MSKDKLTIEVSDGVHTSKITTTEEGITLKANNIELKADNKGIVGEPGKPGPVVVSEDASKKDIRSSSGPGPVGEPGPQGDVESLVISPDPKSVGNLTVQADAIPLKGDVKEKTEVEKDFDKLVEDTINGKYGTGRERMITLGKRYAEVQTEIVKRLRSGK